ncbi:MAG: tRNA (N6-threonylcarbamoyladenosine(37)-N6)-methyltransferase TrmO [Oscillospiraceae bacterium]|nr:tRNA (N6-threonylcarbamoyladenosine(37)-N6)-methyltransferase TrmO [Oscillospiraceae bacterium]
MESKYELRVIARIYNDFPEKFGIPRQSGLVPDMRSVIVFENDYRSDDALRGLEGYSHLWLIWQFSENLRDGWRPTVRPPRLGGNRRMGVFATRSPFRPNALGLSSVALEAIERSEKHGSVLIVSGADLMSGTPIFDIKPYVRFTDSHPEARSGFADDCEDYSLKVDFPEDLLEKIELENRKTLIQILENDPRPSYQCDGTRVYKMSFGRHTVSFTADERTLTVTDVSDRPGGENEGA